MITKENIEITVNNKNLKYYRNLIDSNIHSKDIIQINIKNLPPYSKTLIDVRCDECGIDKKMRYLDYKKITNNLSDKYYCQNCKQIKTKQTNLKKYGVENVFQNETIKNKIKQTNHKKYGEDYFSKTKEYITKTKITCLKKYGVDHPLKNKKILEKLEKTNLKKYGVKYSLMNNEIKLKIIKTNIEKYGIEIPLKNKEIITKLVNTNLKKYDNKTPLLNEEIRKKTMATLFENYGVYNPLKSDIIKERVKRTRIDNLLKKYKNLNIVSIEDNVYKFKCDCGKDHEFEISAGLLYHRLKYKTKLCTICNEINSYNNSGFQIELGELIEANCDYPILKNDRIAITPHELDFYIPELKLAFEFNGIYWHSEIYKTPNYHFIKTEASEKQDIRLIHIYEDDWLFKKEIVKSKILNLLEKSQNIHAQKCEIKEIENNSLVKSFLEKNHIQGFIDSKIKLGLFYNNNLISIMTFDDLENGIFEILRFCNELNINIIDGHSILLEYFILNYKPKQIISYCDRGWSSEIPYEKMGFKLEFKSMPNYSYIFENIRIQRLMHKEKNIEKNEEKDEHQIMLSKNIFRIYDSGSLKYVWNYSNVDSKKNCLEIFGYENVLLEYPAQLEYFYNKMLKSGYTIHKYKDIYYQGEYELDFLEKYYYIGIKRGPTIKYEFNDNIHYYYSDFYFEKMNLIIEIKSLKWYEEHLEKNIQKQKSCIEQGYNFIFIIDKDYTTFNKIIKHLTYNKTHSWQYDIKIEYKK